MASVCPSLKLRVLALVTLILLVGMIAGAIFIIMHAREAMRAEISVTLGSIQQFAAAFTAGERGLDRRARVAEFVDAIEGLRHVRIAPAGGRATAPAAGDENRAPRWFVEWIAPDLQSLEPIRLPLGIDGFLVMPDPADEIEEVWEDSQMLLAIACALLILEGACVYLALLHGLRPLSLLRDSFGRLERDDFSVRVSEAAVSELASIHRQFNRMSEVLEQTRERNRQLAGHMITLQEDERRSLARELHDEMAPHLFNIQVDVATANSFLSRQQPEAILERLNSIQAVATQLQTRVRNMLRRLRPQVLDELGLRQALEDLVDNWRTRSPATKWEAEIIGPMESLDDTTAVTVYRVVQEALTNVARHAAAHNVRLKVKLLNSRGSFASIPAPAELEIVVQDDGVGMPEAAKLGLGLTGIEERVRALGGTLALVPGTPTGCCLSARLPIAETQLIMTR